MRDASYDEGLSEGGNAPDPRPSNHGGHTPTPPRPHGLRWDWYELTADGLDEQLVAGQLASATGARIERGKPRNGYAVALELVRGDDQLAAVYGRRAGSPDGEVHIVTTSESCDELVPILRTKYPDHRVSRADSSLDVRSDFAGLDDALVAIATGRGLSHRLVTDSSGGATRYVGAPSSEIRVRLYRKSEQLRALHPERAQTIPDGIVRFELQARPGKREVKAAVAGMSPADVWGLSQWSQLVADELLGVEAPRVSTHFRRPSEYSRSLYWLGEFYGRTIRDRAAEVGRDQAVAELLKAVGL